VISICHDDVLIDFEEKTIHKSIEFVIFANSLRTVYRRVRTRTRLRREEEIFRRELFLVIFFFEQDANPSSTRNELSNRKYTTIKNSLEEFDEK